MARVINEPRAMGDILNDLKLNTFGTIKIKGLKVTKAQAKSILNNNFKPHQKLGVYYTRITFNAMGYYHIGDLQK